MDGKAKTVMKKLSFILILSFLVFISQVGFAENVSFKSSSGMKDGNPLMLTGVLSKPEGDGPFPAAVLMHGCRGLKATKKWIGEWSNRLVSWGYVTLQVDSFEPRGIESICSSYQLMGRMGYVRVPDAYDAKSFLASLSYVNKSRVAVLGWSHGGLSVARAINKEIKEITPFSAAVAFYPWCEYMVFKNAPFLILIGELDDWTPAKRCKLPLSPDHDAFEVKLKIYKGAYHCFDMKGVDKTYNGHRLLYNPEAAEDSIIQVKNFLAKHLK
jgi:dienelactone hydrolase